MKDISRYEKKYAVSQYESFALHQLLKNVLEVDENANGDDGYLVRSLYFDTPFHKDFYEKADGLHERCKVRLRIYHPDSLTAKLELKEKSGELQRKRSLNLSREQAIEMMHGNYECLREIDTPFSNYMYAYMKENLYKPKCVVEYKRVAFCVQANDIRVTHDNYNYLSLKSDETPHPEKMDLILPCEKSITIHCVKENRALVGKTLYKINYIGNDAVEKKERKMIETWICNI